MQIKSFKVENFRNLERLEIEPGDSVNIVYGDNTSGKTNLIEAGFVLCLGRSQRQAKDSVLITSESDYYRIEGVINNGEKDLTVAVAFQNNSRKKITIDKVAVRASELYDNFAAVTAGPEDSEIISGAPSARRNFLDIYLSQFSNRYLQALVDYRKVLAQKNAALKEGQPAFPYNELLGRYGAMIMSARIEFIERLSMRASQLYEQISSGGQLGLQYQPSIELTTEMTDESSIAEEIVNQLEQLSEKEKILQTSLAGPHRDELEIRIGPFPARTHGSQGEWRSAAVSLKLAVYHVLKEKQGTAPILFLDEIFAELDQKRSTALMEALGQFGQLFLTTAVEPPQSLSVNSRRFRLQRGTITEIS